VLAYLQDLLPRLARETKLPPEQLRDWLPDRCQPPPKPPRTVDDDDGVGELFGGR
jgi:hypothetical protein